MTYYAPLPVKRNNNNHFTLSPFSTNFKLYIFYKLAVPQKSKLHTSYLPLNELVLVEPVQSSFLDNDHTFKYTWVKLCWPVLTNVTHGSSVVHWKGLLKVLWQEFEEDNYLWKHKETEPPQQGERLRVRFFKKIQDWILESERIRKRILRFFTKQINPRSLGSWCVKGTEESTPSKETQNPFSDSFGFKNPILDFLKETHPKWLFNTGCIIRVKQNNMSFSK